MRAGRLDGRPINFQSQLIDFILTKDYTVLSVLRASKAIERRLRKNTRKKSLLLTAI